jgi:hypothetical protein
MKQSRFFALILAGVAAAVPSFADDRADQVIDRIVAGEQQFLSQMKDLHPFVETYIQEMDRSGSTPLRDHYMLTRLDLAKSADGTSMTESDRFKPSLVERFYAGQLVFRPAGFTRMVFPDRGSFNRATYKFDYSRREFLGDIRCLVFEVSPMNDKDAGRFMGNIWVDDRDYRIVRFNGKFTHGSHFNMYFHFDSWRVNVATGMWVPAFVYVEEGNQAAKQVEKYSLKAQVRLWGYANKSGGNMDELSQILIDSDAAVDNAGPKDMLPLESQRSWERQAEQNVLDKLERSGLLAPKGEVDKVLNTVVNNLEVTNHIDADVQCRVLLTTPMETFSIYKTIVISRGLLDVLPDEASLAMVLSGELAHIALGHKTPTAFAFGDETMFADRQILDRLNVARTPAEMAEAGKKSVEILNNSPYADKLANAGLFLKAVGSRMPSLTNLVIAHLGNGFANRENLDRLAALAQKAPPLDDAKLEQISALPLGSRVKLNPWTNQITLVKTEQLTLTSAREKMPFEVTPVMLHLTRVGTEEGTKVAEQLGGGQ